MQSYKKYLTFSLTNLRIIVSVGCYYVGPARQGPYINVIITTHN